MAERLFVCLGHSKRGSAGGRAARAFRLLLLLVLALAAVEYLLGFILEAFPLYVAYPYTSLYKATQPTIRRKSANAGRKPEDETEHKPESTTKRRSDNATVKFPSDMTRPDIAGDSTMLLITKIMNSIKNSATTGGGIRNEAELPLCDSVPPDLGPILANKTIMELDAVEKKYPEVNWGGHFSPLNCTARHKVAIIVPYRDRQQNFPVFLNHMHPFLMKQQIEYGIFIVEQEGTHVFNKAKLMNVGFLESQKQKSGGWQCFIFHDIDLLPLDQRNMYSCPRQPRHMSASIDTFDFKLPYEDIFGGVTALTLEQFRKVNGFSNRYWGWCCEDDEMAYRVKKMNFHIARYKMSIARYTMLNHKKLKPNPESYKLLTHRNQTFEKEGLSTLKYVLVDVVHHHLFTHIVANVDEYS